MDKIFPAFVILYFIWKRNRSVIAGAILAGSTLALIQIIISGPEVFLSFFEILFDLAAFGQPEGVYESYSILAFASRLFQEHNHVAPLLKSETLYTITRFLLTGGALFIAFYATISSGRHQRGENLSWRFDLEYSLIVFTSLLVGSTLWISGLPTLLLFYVLTLRHQHRFHNPHTIRFICLLSYALMMIDIPLVLIVTATGARVSAIILSAGFFGAILLWGLTVVLLRQSDEALAHDISRPQTRRAGFSYRP